MCFFLEFPNSSRPKGNVLALGLGLLERTEAVLDLLLQLAESQEHGEDAKPTENDPWKYSIYGSIDIEMISLD